MDDSVSILIGVGGTGAKVVEAALVLMAAGVGPAEVHVGLVDQDQSNGNTWRTRQLLDSIANFQRVWRAKDGANHIDWEQAGADPVSIGSVRVMPLFPEENNALWCPEGNDATLATIIGRNLDDDRRALNDLLFMRGPEEQELPLGKGYRGRAHVGATALVAAMIEEDSALMERLHTLLEDPAKRRVNVFVIGSAFGGTGAAGFPTLTRALHRLRRSGDLANRANVTLGGLLMLPYFSFNDDDGDGSAVVTSDELLPKAQLALEYYSNLFESERAFDRFYALGWGGMFHLGYHEAGAAEQSNPALPPELFAATAAMDFFRAGTTQGKAADATRVMLAARDGFPIHWRDLPGSTDIEPRLARLLRFSVYWRYLAERLIDAPRKITTGWRKNWIQDLTGGARAIDAERELATLRDLIDRVMLWAATVERTGHRHWTPGPWSLRQFVTETESPIAPVQLRGQLTEREVLDGFDQLIRVDSGEVAPRAAPDVHHDLEAGRIAVANRSSGIGRAVATVIKATGLLGN